MATTSRSTVDSAVAEFISQNVQKTQGSLGSLNQDTSDHSKAAEVDFCRQAIPVVRQRICNILQRKNSKLPIHQLPRPVFTSILHLSLDSCYWTVENALDTRTDDSYRLQALRLVCRRWNESIPKEPSLWTFISSRSNIAEREMALTRSGTLPLVAYVDFGRHAPTMDYSAEPSFFYAQLTPHARRLQYLSISPPPPEDESPSTESTSYPSRESQVKIWMELLRRLGDGLRHLLIQGRELPLPSEPIPPSSIPQEIPSLPHLRTLRLRYISISLQGLLAALAASKQLEELYLRQVSFTDASSENVWVCPPYKPIRLDGLRVFDLVHTHIAPIHHTLAYITSPSCPHTSVHFTNSDIPILEHPTLRLTVGKRLSSSVASLSATSDDGVAVTLADVYMELGDQKFILGAHSYRTSVSAYEYCDALETLDGAARNLVTSLDLRTTDWGCSKPFLLRLARLLPNITHISLPRWRMANFNELDVLTAPRNYGDGLGFRWAYPRLRSLEIREWYTDPDAEPHAEIIGCIRKLTKLARARKDGTIEPRAGFDPNLVTLETITIGGEFRKDPKERNLIRWLRDLVPNVFETEPTVTSVEPSSL